MDVIKEVIAERKRQDEKWGGPKHDDKHIMRDWHHWIKQRCCLSDEQLKDHKVIRKELIEIAALAVAAVESLDRKASCDECGGSGYGIYGKPANINCIKCNP